MKVWIVISEYALLGACLDVYDSHEKALAQKRQVERVLDIGTPPQRIRVVSKDVE